MEHWKKQLFDHPPGAPLLVDALHLGAPHSGNVPLVDASVATASPVLLNRFVLPPRVDVHCHLTEVCDESNPDQVEIQRAFAALLACGYDTHWESELQLKALLDPWIRDACGQRLTTGNNVSAFVTFALSNNSLSAVPYVLGAAMRAPRPFPGLRPHNQLAPLNAIAVPLVLDMSFMPLFCEDPEGIAAAAERIALAGRDIRFRRIKRTRERDKLPVHLQPYFDGALPVYYTDFSEAALRRALEVTAEIARQSRGSLQPFLPFDPRRWTARSRQAVQEGAFDNLRDYLESHLFSKRNQASRDKPCCGFAGLKFYTRHGWLLEGNEILYGDEIGSEVNRAVNEVIQFAVEHDVPITNHHSPGGTPLNGFLVPPMRLVERNATSVPANPSDFDGSSQSYAEWLAWTAAAETAFLCEYVERTASPSNWGPLLERYQNLRVNLAHAGSSASMYAYAYPAQCKQDVKLVMNRLLGRSSPTDKSVYGVELSDVEGLLESPMVVQGELFRDCFWEAVALRLFRYCVGIQRREDTAPPGRFVRGRTSSFTHKWKSDFSRATRQCAAWEVFHDKAHRGDGQITEPLDQSSLPCSFVKDGWSLAQEELLRLMSNDLWNRWVATWWTRTGTHRRSESRKENWFETIARLAKYENVYVDFSYSTGQRSMLTGHSRSAPGSRLIVETSVANALRRMFSDPQLESKAMFGSDWFLIERDLGSADDAWSFYRRCFELARLDDSAWERFSSSNALQFLNLATRADAVKEFMRAGSDPEARPWHSVIDSIAESSALRDLVPSYVIGERKVRWHIEGGQVRIIRNGAPSAAAKSGEVQFASIPFDAMARIELTNGGPCDIPLRGHNEIALDDAAIFFGRLPLELLSADAWAEPTLAGSVGEGGDNYQPDCVVVQELLQGAGFSAGRSDGKVDAMTVAAIRAFQQVNFGWSDGRVDPHGKTIRALRRSACDRDDESTTSIVLDVTDLFGSDARVGPLDEGSPLADRFYEEVFRAAKKDWKMLDAVRSPKFALDTVREWFRHKVRASLRVTIVKHRVLLIIETPGARVVFLRQILSAHVNWSLKTAKVIAWNTALTGVLKKAATWKGARRSIIFTVGFDVVEEFLLKDDFSPIRLLSTIAYDVAKGAVVTVLAGAAAVALASAFPAVAFIGVVAGVAVVVTIALLDDRIEQGLESWELPNRRWVNEKSSDAFGAFLADADDSVQSFVLTAVAGLVEQVSYLAP